MKTVAEASEQARKENPHKKMTVYEAIKVVETETEGKRYYEEVGVWDFFNNSQRMYYDIESFTTEAVKHTRTVTLIGKNGDKFFVKGHVNNYKEVSE